MTDLAMCVGDAEVNWDLLIETGGVQDDAIGIWLHRSPRMPSWGRDDVDREPQAVWRNYTPGNILSVHQPFLRTWIISAIHASWLPSQTIRYRTVEWGGTAHFDVPVAWVRR